MSLVPGDKKMFQTSVIKKILPRNSGNYKLERKIDLH